MITSDWGSCVQNGVATLACIPVVLTNIINFLVIFAGIVCVFLIIYAGYRFVMSEGDPEKIANARKTLTYAIAGLLVVLFSFFIIGFVAKYTGVGQIAPSSNTP